MSMQCQLIFLHHISLFSQINEFTSNLLLLLPQFLNLMISFCRPPIATVDDCCCRRSKNTSSSPSTTMEINNPLLLESLTSRYSSSIIEALDDLPLDLSFLITDPYIANHPIIFASRGFLSISGFSREEIIGRNARMFQGPDTDRRSVLEIREAIREEKEMQISLMNYRKDGTRYWMLFHLCPVFGRDDGRLAHFFAVQIPIGRRQRGGLVFGGCRDELRCNLLRFDSYGDSDERREAGDGEKKKAVDGAAEILLKLVKYSKITGRVVCGKRCSDKAGSYSLSSFLCSCLGRIKQSFVL